MYLIIFLQEKILQNQYTPTQSTHFQMSSSKCSSNKVCQVKYVKSVYIIINIPDSKMLAECQQISSRSEDVSRLTTIDVAFCSCSADRTC